jgi:NAD(P)-dependent dehydrogenase (short-subunit alcohol dehydrogenase family)
MTTFTVDKSSLKEVTGKTILITGGSSGIGLSTAELFHSLSNNVIVLDRAEPPASSLTSSARFLFQQCDITSWRAQRAAFQAGEKKFGHIDVAFVNAGIAEFEDQFFTDRFDEDGELAEPDRRVVDVDLHAADDTVKLAIHFLRKNKGGGSIVITTSLAGYLASAGAPLYSAAKHGL